MVWINFDASQDHKKDYGNSEKNNNDNKKNDDSKRNDNDIKNRDTPFHTVAKFMYQLKKLLIYDNNETTKWITGCIKVHCPESPEKEVLNKYFGLSKSSF